MNIEDILKQLKEILPAENFKVQPDTARGELIQLEKKYNINTSYFLETPLEDTNVSEEDCDKWINTFDTYINFGGVITEINHIPLCDNNKQFIKPNKNEKNTKEYATKKSKEPEDGFLALSYSLIISIILNPSFGWNNNLVFVPVASMASAELITKTLSPGSTAPLSVAINNVCTKLGNA